MNKTFIKFINFMRKIDREFLGYRINRKRFVLLMLFGIICLFALVALFPLDRINLTNVWLYTLVGIIFRLYFCLILVGRLHDFNVTGYLSLFVIIFLNFILKSVLLKDLSIIALILVCLAPGTQGSNDFSRNKSKV